MHFNWIDYIVIAIFLFSVLGGFFRGFVREIVSLITWITAFVVAIMFSNSLAAYFTSSASVQNGVSEATNAISTTPSASYIAVGVSFFLLFIGTIIVGTIIGYILNIAFQTGGLGVGNRLFGAIFGLFRAFIITLVIIFLMQLTPLSEEEWWGQSRLVEVFQPAVKWLENIVSPSLVGLKEKFGETLQGVGSHLKGVTDKVNEATE